MKVATNEFDSSNDPLNDCMDYELYPIVEALDVPKNLSQAQKKEFGDIKESKTFAKITSLIKDSNELYSIDAQIFNQTNRLVKQSNLDKFLQTSKKVSTDLMDDRRVQSSFEPLKKRHTKQKSSLNFNMEEVQMRYESQHIKNSLKSNSLDGSQKSLPKSSLSSQKKQKALEYRTQQALNKINKDIVHAKDNIQTSLSTKKSIEIKFDPLWLQTNKSAKQMFLPLIIGTHWLDFKQDKEQLKFYKFKDGQQSTLKVYLQIITGVEFSQDEIMYAYQIAEQNLKFRNNLKRKAERMTQVEDGSKEEEYEFLYVNPQLNKPQHKKLMTVMSQNIYELKY